MVIREAAESDISAIVSLLRNSLGENLMPKSERYWRWKHIENPFGQSPVLLAFEGDVMIGVRAFMQWKWKKGDQYYYAVRAVDTATHPDFQGKGVFKKLTLSQLENCRQNGTHFVFNTPNDKSKPGYLKMGWKEAGKLPIHLQLIRPFSMTLNLVHPDTKPYGDVDDKSANYYVTHKGLDHLLACNYKNHKEHLITHHSVESLKWRYNEVPVVKYHAGGIEKNGGLRALFFYRIKSSRAGNELRITDLFAESKNYMEELHEIIREKIKHHRVHYVTVSGTNIFPGKGWMIFKKLKVGPTVTVRSDNEYSLRLLNKFNQWDPSLGDLELF